MKIRTKAPWFIDPKISPPTDTHIDPKGEGWTCATCEHMKSSGAGWAVCEFHVKDGTGMMVTGHVMSRTLPTNCPLIDQLAKAVGEEHVKQPKQCLACDHTEQTCPDKPRRQGLPSASTPWGACPFFWQDT